MNITDYFNGSYADYAMYDNSRKLACIVDGLKSSARKCVYTMLDKNITSNVKLSILRSKCSEHTEYLHGDQSLVGVMVGLAQDYVGSNNVPLLAKEGNFGTRLGPNPAADRYIFTCLLPIARLIFRKDDDAILTKQEFEGNKIEPRHYVPLIPIGLVNGVEGISTGFAQKVAARNPIDVIKAIKQAVNGRRLDKVHPWYAGFNGTVTPKEDGGYIVSGSITVKNTTQIVITEVPIGYNYNSYCKVLDTLVEQKKIVSYTDLCDTKTDKFSFVVKMTRAQTSKKSEADLVNLLKLTKSFKENYTFLNEHGVVTVYDSYEDIIKEFVEVRVRYYDIRKEHMLAVLRRELLILKNRVKFIKDVHSGAIVVNKRSKDDIERQLTDGGYDQVDDSFDYLLRMQIWSLTKEKAAALMDELRAKKDEFIELRDKDVKEWYLEELDELMKAIKKGMK